MKKKVIFKDGTTRKRLTRVRGPEDQQHLINLINECLEDITEFGKSRECIVFYVNGELEDYATEQGELIYPEEDMKLMHLIDLLIELYTLILPTRMSAVIRAHRMALDMSQKQLADIIGTTHPVIRTWESGKVIPSTKFLTKIFKTLEIDFKYLIEK